MIENHDWLAAQTGGLAADDGVVVCSVGGGNVARDVYRIRCMPTGKTRSASMRSSFCTTRPRTQCRRAPTEAKRGLGSSQQRPSEPLSDSRPENGPPVQGGTRDSRGGVSGRALKASELQVVLQFPRTENKPENSSLSRGLFATSTYLTMSRAFFEEVTRPFSSFFLNLMGWHPTVLANDSAQIALASHSTAETRSTRTCADA